MQLEHSRTTILQLDFNLCQVMCKWNNFWLISFNMSDKIFHIFSLNLTCIARFRLKNRHRVIDVKR